MVIPWVKAAVLFFNAGTSATVGGICSYCIFGGENKEERQKIDEINLAWEKAKEEFEENKKKTLEDQEVKLQKVKEVVAGLKRTELCLKGAEESYNKRIKDLGILQYFQIVRFQGQGC